ncbi:hypothetical protein RN001_010249 [Aquatica leii]|uniref:Uncharacterized protein n=1 Tax=Aquatica leii TaxID=1421715 RepID=A0AAN7QHC4_9COLE|nr:hypothetical protein RN001_010249 [Aquatica leii]
MPRKRVLKTNRVLIDEANMKHSIIKVFNGTYSERRAAIIYEIRRTTLQCRIKRILNKYTKESYLTHNGERADDSGNDSIDEDSPKYSMANMHNKEDVKKRESVDLHTLYPVVVDSPETSVTFDTDSIDSEKLSGQFNISQQALSPGSTVHIEHSSDVVVGSLTQFHGPVTIYQNINSQKDGKIVTNGVATDLNTTKASTLENKPTKTQQTLSEVLIKTPTKRLFVYSVIIFVTLITVVLGVTLSLKLFTKENEIVTENSDGLTVTTSQLTSHYVHDKEEWGGRASLNFTKPLAHPVQYVLISHTAGRFCRTFSECSTILGQIQSMHVTNKSPDIWYNFMIGGDESVYVGRGWDVVNHHKNNTIGVCFIGNYVFDQLSPKMISALEDLLAIGVNLKKLKPDYKIVCHNQTVLTISPGPNVYDKISKLSHFYEGRLKI